MNNKDHIKSNSNKVWLKMINKLKNKFKLWKINNNKWKNKLNS